jgi:branched-chain amino acid transport system ATP-binding protein
MAGRDIRPSPRTPRAPRLGWVPQERGMWRSLDVDEHLAAVARPGVDARKVFELFPRLAERRRIAARSSRRRAADARDRARARDQPALLLLDEPLEGLAPIVVKDLVGVLREIAAAGREALVLVEQHARIALSIASRAPSWIVAASSWTRRRAISRPIRIRWRDCSSRAERA